MTPLDILAQSTPRLPVTATASVVLLASFAITAAWLWRLYR
jgi:hypothetical protein